MKNLSQSVIRYYIIGFCACFLALISCSTYGQNQIGVELSAQNYNIRYLTDNVYEQETSAMTRLKYGLYYQRFFSSGLSMKTAITYANNAFRLQDADQEASRMIMTVHTQNVGWDVLCRISAKSGSLKPYFEIGPAVSYVTNRSIALIGENPDPNFDGEYQKSFNKMIVAGLGFTSEIGSTSFDLFFRYEMGFDNLYRGSTEGVIQRSKAFTFGAAIKLFSFGNGITTSCVKRKCKK